MKNNNIYIHSRLPRAKQYKSCNGASHTNHPDLNVRDLPVGKYISLMSAMITLTLTSNTI